MDQSDIIHVSSSPGEEVIIVIIIIIFSYIIIIACWVLREIDAWLNYCTNTVQY